MDNYKNILVAVDLSEDSEHVCRKGLTDCTFEDNRAKLTIVYDLVQPESHCAVLMPF